MHKVLHTAPELEGWSARLTRRCVATFITDSVLAVVN